MARLAALVVFVLAGWSGLGADAACARACPDDDAAIALVWPEAPRLVRTSGQITELCGACARPGPHQPLPATMEAALLEAQRTVLPALAPLLHMPFFRYFEIDLGRPCAFWPNDGVCVIRDCGVEAADLALQESLHRVARVADAAADRFQPADALSGDDWVEGRAASGSDGGEHTEYVDLVANPERYTAFGGAAARVIWREIYYNTDLTAHPPAAPGGSGSRPPVEAAADARSPASVTAEEALEALQRETDRRADEEPVQAMLFRAVSGMQASINTHLAIHHLLDKDAHLWGVDLDLYRARVGGHPRRIANLVFAYRLLLRAVALAGDYLLGYPLHSPAAVQHDRGSGSAAADAMATVEHLRALLQTRRRWALAQADPNETRPFAGAAGRAQEFDVRDHVRNITRLIDCVGCDRCRLWGRVQVTGIGTALRVLYAPDRSQVFRTLHRHDLVALVQTLGRFASSLSAIRLLQPYLA